MSRSYDRGPYLLNPSAFDKSDRKFSIALTVFSPDGHLFQVRPAGRVPDVAI